MKICGLFKKLDIETSKIKISTLNIKFPEDLEKQKLKIGNNGKIEIVHPLVNSTRISLEETKYSETYYSIGESGFFLPESHLIEFKTHKDIPSDPLLSPSFFISQVISISTTFYALPENFNFLTNFLQYKEKSLFYLPNSKELGELLDHSLSFWDNLSVESKIIITNLLHFYNKSCLTKSSYDLYQSLYSVNDLIFKYFFNSEKGLLNLSTNESSKAYYKIKHDLRMKYLLSALNIDIDPSLLKNIVTVRNNISHELNWDDFILDFTFNEKTKENEKNTLLLQELIGLMIVKTICPHKRNQNKKLIDSRLYKVNLY